MPNVKRNEGKQDFLTRCTKMLVEDEGKKSDQAFAICNSIWNDERGLSEEDVCFNLSASLKQNEDNPDEIFITAHSGKLINGYWDDFIIDVKGIEYNEKLPLLLEHNYENRIGFVNMWKEGGQLFAKGKLLSNEKAGQIKNDMKEGFPMEASIGVWPEKVKFIEKGKEKVNGIEVEGPVEIWEKSVVRELSLTTLGADDSTATIIMNQKNNINKEALKMPDQEDVIQEPEEEPKELSIDEKVDTLTSTVTVLADSVNNLATKVEDLSALSARVDELAEKIKNDDESTTEEEKPQGSENMNQEIYSMLLSAAIEKSKLPEVVASRLEKKLSSRQFSMAEIKEEIKDAKEMVDKLLPPNMELSVKVTGSEVDNGLLMLSDIFARKAHSIKLAYQKITGDEEIRGRVPSTNGVRLSLTTANWTNALENVMNKELIMAYEHPERMQWKRICSTGVAKDFRAHSFTAIGGYGSLPTVAEKGPYMPLTSPGDQKASISVTKKGGTEDITIEQIKNDDVDAVRQIPMKMATAAAITLSEFVFVTLIEGNPNFDFDTTAIYDAGHSNTATGALAEATLSAGRLAMVTQTEITSGKRLGIPPKFLLVPPALYKTAYELLVPANVAYTVPSASAVHSGAFNRGMSLEILEIIDFTDANNWYLFADPMRYPCLKVIFLDGKEDPEMLIQDLPTSGSLFTNDVITFKLRHIYGGDWTDYRGTYGGIVA